MFADTCDDSDAADDDDDDDDDGDDDDDDDDDDGDVCSCIWCRNSSPYEHCSKPLRWVIMIIHDHPDKWVV